MKIILITLSMLLYGCASKPVKLENAKRINLKSGSRYSKESDKKNASIVIIRDSGAGGGLCAVDISIDSHTVASLNTSDYIEIFVKPGNYFLGAKHQCQGILTEEDINIKTKEKQQFRVQIGGQSPISILRTK
jgi:hypothetical protein